MSARAAESEDRASAIDAFRCLAFAAVVLIHTAATGDGDPLSPGHTIVALSRFAVPFFFVTAGYFLRAQPVGTTIVRLARRLVPPLLFWGSFYLLLFDRSLARLRHVDGIVRWLVVGQPGYHLWFLSALGSSAAILAIARSRLQWPALFALAVLFYVAGLVLGPWRQALGIAPIPFGPRNGPFFGFLFLAIGAWLRTRASPRVSAPVAAGLFVMAGAALLGENLLLFRAGLTVGIDSPDFAIATVPFGVAAFVLAAALPDKGWGLGRLAAVGRLTMGAYLVHPAFIDLFQRLIVPDDLTGRLLVALLTVPASFAAVSALSRISGVRRLVT